jgi:hypothetical protein
MSTTVKPVDTKVDVKAPSGGSAVPPPLTKMLSGFVFGTT